MTNVQIKVLLFASAREAAGGIAQVDVTLPSGQATTTHLRQRLADDYPRLASMVLDEDSITLALNEEYVAAGETLSLKTGDTVAVRVAECRIDSTRKAMGCCVLCC